MDKLKYKSLLLPAFFVLLNLIIKGIFLSNNSIAGDEPFSIYYAQMSLASIVELLSKGNNPPFYEILLHFWIKIFGISEFSVRMPSLIFNCITVIFIYRIALNHFNIRIAIYSSLLFVFSNYQILFAHESRVYALVGMLTSMSMFYFLELITRGISSKKQFILFLLANIFLVYSHYFGFFVLFIQFIFLVTNKELFAKYWKQLILSIAIVTLFYLPLLAVIIDRFIFSSVHGTWVKPPDGIKDIYGMLRGFTNAPVVTVTTILLFVASVIKYFTVNKEHVKVSPPTKLIIVWFFFPFFFIFAISFWIPIFLDRYLMFASISLYIIIAVAADFLIERIKFRYIIPFLLCGLFVITVKPNRTNKRNVKEMISKIEVLKTDNTLVIICPYDFVLNYTYYYNIDVFKKVNTESISENIEKELNKDNIYLGYNLNEINYEKYKHIIYLDAASNYSDPNNNIMNTLSEKYNLENKFEFDIFYVYEFKSK